MNIREQDIRDITGAVWTSVLQSEATGLPAGVPPEITSMVVTGCVQIGGAWEGAVTIQCSTKLARGAAASMFETDPATTSDDEIQDAVGELANVVGGNIKALLPGPTKLSLPFVVEGTMTALRICDCSAVHTVWFHSMGEAFVVTLLSRTGASAPHVHHHNHPAPGGST